MLNRYCTQRELQLNQLEHKCLHPQIHFATLTHDNHINPVNYLVRHENLLTSQKDDCYPSIADFKNDQLSILIFYKGEIIKNNPLESFSFEAVKPLQSLKNQSLFQLSAILNGTDMTDNHNPIERRRPENDDPFPLIYL